MLPRCPSATLLSLGLLLMLLQASVAGRVPMPGGVMDVPVTDPGVQKAADFALAAYNQASNSLFYCRKQQILSAKSQVVEGIKYILEVEVVNTMCRKNSGDGFKNVDLENCALPPKAEQQRQICTFQVWSRPWLNDTRLLKHICKQATS